MLHRKAGFSCEKDVNSKCPMHDDNIYLCVRNNIGQKNGFLGILMMYKQLLASGLLEIELLVYYVYYILILTVLVELYFFLTFFLTRG